MNKEILIQYTKIWEEYNNNPSFIFTEEQRNIINYVNKEAKNDEKLANLLEQLKKSNDKIKIIEEYFNPQETNNQENKYEVIAEVFGIDINDIQHKVLNNGKELFMFYDKQVGRNIILENEKNGISLVEQLSEIQRENKKYQTSDNEQNAKDILKDKTNKENCELSVIPIQEIGDHLSKVQNLSLEDYHKLLFLINNIKSLNISHINIENIIGFDDNEKIYEVYIDQEQNYKIGEPNTSNYIEDKNKANQTNLVENSSKEPELQFDYLDEEIQKKVIMLYQNSGLLDKLPEAEKERWQTYINLYNKKIEQENQIIKEQHKPKIKQYIKSQEDNHGYINMVSLISIIGVVVGIVCLYLVIIR